MTNEGKEAAMHEMKVIKIGKGDYDYEADGKVKAEVPAGSPPSVLVTIDIAAILAELRGIIEEVTPLVGGFMPAIALAALGAVGLGMSWLAVLVLR